MPDAGYLIVVHSPSTAAVVTDPIGTVSDAEFTAPATPALLAAVFDPEASVRVFHKPEGVSWYEEVAGLVEQVTYRHEGGVDQMGEVTVQFGRAAA